MARSAENSVAGAVAGTTAETVCTGANPSARATASVSTRNRRGAAVDARRTARPRCFAGGAV